MHRALTVVILFATCLSLQTQQAGSDSERQRGLTVGGYGEMALLAPDCCPYYPTFCPTCKNGNQIILLFVHMTHFLIAQF